MKIEEFDTLVKKIKLTSVYLENLQKAFSRETGRELKFFNNLNTEDQILTTEDVIEDLLRRKDGV